MIWPSFIFAGTCLIHKKTTEVQSWNEAGLKMKPRLGAQKGMVEDIQIIHNPTQGLPLSSETQILPPWLMVLNLSEGIKPHLEVSYSKYHCSEALNYDVIISLQFPHIRAS